MAVWAARAVWAAAAWAAAATAAREGGGNGGDGATFPEWQWTYRLFPVSVPVLSPFACVLK